MRIGVISDTHIPVTSQKLPQKVYDYLEECDLIIHAGDVVEMSFIDELKKLAEVQVVAGNMDSDIVRQRYKEKLLINVEGKKIGVIHGRGLGFKVLQFVRQAFKNKPDIIIFGHSHDVVNEEIDGVLFFNPGSPTDTIFAKYRSFGIIEINGDDIKAEIIKVDD